MANIPFLNNAFFAAKVGIGVLAPAEKLEVSGVNSRVTTNSTADGQVIGFQARYINSSTLQGSFLYSTGSATLAIANHFGGNNANYSDIYFQNCNNGSTVLQTRMTIKGSSGNVGIGTINPIEKLQVEGKVYVQGNGQNWNETTPGTTRGSVHFDPGTNVANTGNALTFGASDTPGSPNEGSTAQAGIYTRSDGAYGTKMYFATTDSYASGSKTAMMIDYNGRVGIGTTGPVAKLMVEEPGTGEGLRIDGSSGGFAFVVRGGTNYTTSIRAGLGIGSSLFSTVPPANGLLVEGNVGIGVTSPLNPLDVRGTGTVARFQSSNQFVDCIFVNSGTTNYLGFNNASFQVYLSGGAGSDIVLNITETAATFRNDVIVRAALLSNQDNTDVDTGTETVANVAIATYTAAFFDFVIKKGTNVRSGTVYACHDGTNVQFTETSTQDLGDTSDVVLSVDISGTNMRLRATSLSESWSIKSLIRAI